MRKTSASKAAAIIRIMGGPKPDPRFVSAVTNRITRGEAWRMTLAMCAAAFWLTLIFVLLLNALVALLGEPGSMNQSFPA